MFCLCLIWQPYQRRDCRHHGAGGGGGAGEGAQNPGLPSLPSTSQHSASLHSLPPKLCRDQGLRSDAWEELSSPQQTTLELWNHKCCSS